MLLLDKFTGRLGNRLFQFAYIYSQFRKGEIPDIYVQDPKYFEEFADEIKEMFSEGIGEDNRVAIHVRRGDYVNNPFYVDLCKTDYYEKAIKQFPGKTFLVFSDNIDFCKEYFRGDMYEFEEGSEYEDLNHIASCSGVIMANSSFSWWGAFLSKGKVIAPKAWYTDGIKRTKCLKTWLQI
jgi:Glycosyl transferase family 11